MKNTREEHEIEEPEERSDLMGFGVSYMGLNALSNIAAFMEYFVENEPLDIQRDVWKKEDVEKLRGTLDYFLAVNGIPRKPGRLDEGNVRFVFYTPEDELELQVVELKREVRSLESALKSADKSPKQKSKQKTYLMLDELTGFIKIGKSSAPSTREKTLLSQSPSIHLVCTIPDNIEQELHEAFSSKRGRGEWFDLDPQDLMKIKNSYVLTVVNQEMFDKLFNS